MALNARTAVAALSLSAAALVGILVKEGWVDTAVAPLPGDVPTYGFGTTTHEDGSPVRSGERIDPLKALVRAQRDVVRFEGGVKQCVTVPLFQYEYDAFVRFSYNVGTSAFCKSTMVKKLNAGDYAGACAEFDRWTMFQGKDCRVASNRCSGLVKTRVEERALCEGKQ